MVLVAVLAAWLIWPRGSPPVTLEAARADLGERRRVDAEAVGAEGDGSTTGGYAYAAEDTRSAGFCGVTYEDRAVPDMVNVGMDVSVAVAVVGGESRPALPVEMVSTMDGGMAGSWTQRYWPGEATLLPRRIERRI